MFEHYFTLEEAARLLPMVRRVFEETHEELKNVQDDIVLSQRILLTRKREGQEPPAEAVALLERKISHYEKRLEHWLSQLTDRGILVKDVSRGLIDFPYRAADGSEYLLCWELADDDSLLYFHGLEEGYRGRRPITLLPD
ncbi:MAG: DUF2203 domain-containing protein [Candidatus Melainabacteria bacterium]|nr:DUF2203 domain-containing protein [Candidatus Melainabacteria bacterium]